MDEGCITKVVLWVCMSVAIAAKANEEYFSPVALVADKQGKMLYVAEATAKQVAVFDIESSKVTKTYSLREKPSGLALAPDGSELYVTCASPKGWLGVINLRSWKVRYHLPAGHTPTAPIVSPDGKFLYVCNRFDNNVSVIDVVTQKQIAQIPVQREPVAAAITPALSYDSTSGGRFLFVANHLPVGPADQGYIAAAVSVIDTARLSLPKSAARNVTATIKLPNGAISLKGICISPDGRYVYVTHILARYTVPTTQLERGWMNTNALSIIDAKKKELIATVLLDDVDNGAANPWAVGCSSDGKYICVTHAGTNELSVIDASALLDKIRARHSILDTRYSSRIENELSFLYGIRKRINLPGKGPRALAIVGSYAYIAEYFTDSITIVELNEKFVTRQSSLVSGPMDEKRRTVDVRRRGEMLFNDASLCFQQWQSCASCHPDGRVDALNWDLLNDGIGNSKNTKSMLLAHETPPAMITGVRDRAETAVRAGIKNIQFAMCPEQDAAAIDEYLKSLKAIPSPYLVNGKLSSAGRRGQRIFKKAGCAQCHSGPLFTDMQKYDVGTGRDMEKNRLFDTPTLVEVWRTAPYLYDGRAATIIEVLTTYNGDDKHGVTSNLTEKEINDLTEFVLSQ